MHGVKLVSTPPTNTAGIAWSGLERSGSITNAGKNAGGRVNARSTTGVMQQEEYYDPLQAWDTRDRYDSRRGAGCRILARRSRSSPGGEAGRRHCAHGRYGRPRDERSDGRKHDEAHGAHSRANTIARR